MEAEWSDLSLARRLEPSQSERSEPGKTAENRLERGGRAQEPGQLLGPAIGRTRREGPVRRQRLAAAGFFAPLLR